MSELKFHYDIAGDIMNARKIEKWRQELGNLRGRLANISYDEMVGFAEALGRVRRKASTPHPMYDGPLSRRPSLSIPSHKGSVPKWTAKKILDVLEGDIDTWEIELVKKGEGQDHV